MRETVSFFSDFSSCMLPSGRSKLSPFIPTCAQPVLPLWPQVHLAATARHPRSGVWIFQRHQKKWKSLCLRTLGNVCTVLERNPSLYLAAYRTSGTMFIRLLVRAVGCLGVEDDVERMLLGNLRTTQWTIQRLKVCDLQMMLLKSWLVL